MTVQEFIDQLLELISYTDLKMDDPIYFEDDNEYPDDFLTPRVRKSTAWETNAESSHHCAVVSLSNSQVYPCTYKTEKKEDS